jgi:uncharacterized protein (TIGR00661 family)
MKNTRKVLIAPLDWGVGHCTRCVPLIKHLVSKGYSVLVAGNSWQQIFFQSEIEDVDYINLEGYNVTYAETGIGLAVKILKQIPQILSSIKREHIWLKQIIKDHQIDLVISDNRYGLYSKNIPCFFMTHQLYIQMPILGKLINGINHRFIKRFTECWVPDNEGDLNLSGKLSHPSINKNVKYIGPLSRLNKLLYQKKVTPNTILLILSGPEPQRSILANKVIKALKNSHYSLKIAGANHLSSNDFEHVNFLNNLNTNDLIQAMSTAEIIIARSGYSTLLDLAALQQRAIIIPTPGQTEQVYLMQYQCKILQWHYGVLQDAFSIKDIYNFKSSNWESSAPWVNGFDDFNNKIDL